MKKLYFLFLLLTVFFNVNFGYAQSVIVPKINGYHSHDGFYLSMSMGPNFSRIDNKAQGYYDMSFTGNGGQFDLKIGGTFNDNLIFHGTLISNYITGPKVKSNGSIVKTSNQMEIGETMIGGGFTYYKMPSNIFVSVSGGLGGFSIVNEEEDVDGSTDKGFSVQVKVGKEWWISKNWGFGIGISYLNTRVTNKPTNNYTEKLKSNNFGILFNTTFN